MTLLDIEVGKSCKIISVGTKGALRQHFLDMGVIPGAVVKIVKYAPMGDPIEIKIHGYELTLRVSDAKKIKVELIDLEEFEKNDTTDYKIVPHPGFGESGIFHNEEDNKNILPDDVTLKFALVGNQNCGKTTLFNKLTGSSQHVGNFPGVTVDRKDGQIIGFENTLVTDLPGIYSMSPYTSEEIVSRNFVLNENPHAIINIIDATNIERNLYLTMQLLEMDIPIVVALNMMDEVLSNKGSIKINLLESLLGCPVVPISAYKNEGVDELIKHAIHVAKYQEKPIKQDFCVKEDHGGAIHRAHHTIESIIEDHVEKSNLPLRFCLSKVIEGDKLIIEKLNLDPNELEMIEHVIIQMEDESKMDRNAAIADMRFDFIERVCKNTVIKPKESKQRIRSEKIDKILTGKYTALPCFLLIMSFVFFMTFNCIGAFLQEKLELLINFGCEKMQQVLISSNVNSSIQSLIIDGIFGGVGSVLSFLPIVVTLFFFLSLMEDTGYIARVAFVMDKLLRKIGLSGRSIVPLLIGFGCTVPAVMSTRTLPSSRDRYMTILLTPFMSCTAKLPIYAFFVHSFFPQYSGVIMVMLYLLGIIVGIFIANFFKKSLFKGNAVPFVMELPNYRLPNAKNVMQLLYEKAKDFVTKAFSIILFATIIIWFLQSFDFNLCLVTDSSNSILAKIANCLTPIFKPIGLGNWKIITSLITGVIAKESVVSTLELLFRGSIEILTNLNAIIILIFSLLYTPCVAALASIKREIGLKWTLFVAFFQLVVAWVVCFGVNVILKVVM